MRQKSSLIFLGVFVATLSATTFALYSDARPSDLEGREWLISNYFVNKEQKWPFRKIGQKVDAYLSFESGAFGGSPGCGQFTGTYHKSSGQFTISADWTDDKEVPCTSDQRKNAEQILRSLTNVRRIDVAPAYWDSDSLLLTDAKSVTQVTLSPMQLEKDLSELQDSFWHLAKLQGSQADLSGVTIDIGKGQITFSTVSYFASFPFRYKLAGLKFFPAWSHTIASNESESQRDERLANLFENSLHRISSYDLSQGSLTFLGNHQETLIILNSVRQQSIENRRWRVAKYRGDGNQHSDEEGLVDATEPAEITFLHGRVEGSPGCGGWVGTYKVSGDRVTVNAQWVLAGLCFPEGFAQDRLVENAFKGELLIEENGDHILLRDLSRKARILLVPY
jgi:heat shock protein HslJ